MANNTQYAAQPTLSWGSGPYITGIDYGSSSITVTANAYPMSNTTEKDPELSAEEKLVVAALKGTKTPEQITTLIAIARLTDEKPSDVLDELSEVSKLVSDEIAANVTVASF